MYKSKRTLPSGGINARKKMYESDLYQEMETLRLYVQTMIDFLAYMYFYNLLSTMKSRDLRAEEIRFTHDSYPGTLRIGHSN